VNWPVALPLVIPLATAVVALFGWNSRGFQRIVCLLGSVALLAASLALLLRVDAAGYLVLHVGHWQAPFGIALVADRFSALLVLLAAVASLSAHLYLLSEDDNSLPRPLLFPLLNILMMGVCGAFLTGDLFNLYVWFEVLLMGSFVLLTLGNTRAQLQAAFKYVVLNLLSSLLFLLAAGLVYGLLGTLNFADIGRAVAALHARGITLHESSILLAVSVLLLAAFGIKGALFPAYFWLPASYHTPLFGVAALFSALLTKVGMYSIFRTFSVSFVEPADSLRAALAVIAALSMVIGVLGAASQYEIRRILAFHSVSQMGYILMGLVIATPAGYAAAVFFFLHHGIVKSNLFLAAGVIQRLTGSNDLKNPHVANLLRTSPLLAIAFLLTALSLAGIPPLSGFPAKLGLISAGLDRNLYWLVAVATGVGLLTLFSMLKIWAEAFWRPAAETTPRPAFPLTLVPLALTGLTLALGLAAAPVLAICARAGHQLADPTAYIQAVHLATNGQPLPEVNTP
jgi:multicomponent Na+:H+ antiporter subunit D